MVHAGYIDEALNPHCDSIRGLKSVGIISLCNRRRIKYSCCFSIEKNRYLGIRKNIQMGTTENGNFK